MSERSTKDGRGSGRTSSSSDDELAWWIVGVAGLLVLGYVWRERLRPWLADQDLPLVKVKRSGGFEVDRVDLIPVALLAAAVLLVYLAMRGIVRRRRGRRTEDGPTPH